jgi:hypothetical protein
MAETLSVAAGALVGAAGKGVKGAIAVAGRPAAAAALSAATREAIELPITTEIGLHVGEEIVGGIVGGAAEDLGHAIGDPVASVDLAPSVAGPSWNAPPTIQVPPVNTDYNYSMAEIVETPFTDAVLASSSSPSGASVSAVGA